MPRILIVEDEADIALGLEEDLTCHGYQVETVRDGETAARRGAGHGSSKASVFARPARCERAPLPIDREWGSR